MARFWDTASEGQKCEHEMYKEMYKFKNFLFQSKSALDIDKVDSALGENMFCICMFRLELFGFHLTLSFYTVRHRATQSYSTSAGSTRTGCDKSGNPKKVKWQAIVWYKKRELSILHIQTKKASQHTYPLDKAANIDFLLHPLQEAVRYGWKCSSNEKMIG